MAGKKLKWGAQLRRYVWPASLWRKMLSLFVALVLFFTLLSYGVAQWYINKHANEPLLIGTSFIADYAEKMGLEPEPTLEAIVGDLNIKQIRLVSYWDKIEPTFGSYDFSQLDKQFDTANRYGAKVSLAIGLRQPRWPECHEPSWVDRSNTEQWRPHLYAFMRAVVAHYKDNPALGSYELENEFFMKVFGKCWDFDRGRLTTELALIKQWDPNHPVIISRSNNWIGIPVRDPKPDKYAVSVYKRVWDAIFTHRYFEYPLPPWFYSALAGWGEIVNDRDMLIHELQAEPWPPKGQELWQAPLDEQFKSMDAERLKSRIKYGKDTGMRTIDLWGAEWWYWLKVKKGDPSVWNVVKQAVADADTENQKQNGH